MLQEIFQCGGTEQDAALVVPENARCLVCEFLSRRTADSHTSTTEQQSQRCGFCGEDVQALLGDRVRQSDIRRVCGTYARQGAESALLALTILAGGPQYPARSHGYSRRIGMKSVCAPMDRQGG